ncbi:MAG: diguanylate cyclase, partial [Betaproteobacteria bacterium]
AGIVIISVTPNFFTRFYDEAGLGLQGTVGVFGTDGIVRSRRVGSEFTVESDGSETALLARAASSSSGIYDAKSGADGIERQMAFKKMLDYPLIVTVGQSQDEAFATLYRARKRYWWTAGVAALVIFIFFAVVTALAVRLQRNRSELKLQQNFLRALVENLPTGLAVRDMQGESGRYVVWNEANAAALGVSPERAIGHTVEELMEPEVAAQVAKLDMSMLESPMVQDRVEMKVVPGRGRRLIHVVRAPIFGPDGDVQYIMASSADVTDERRHTDQLQLASKVFETTADGIVVTDGDDRVVMVNAAFSKLTGFDASEMLGFILAETPFRPLDLAESRLRMARLQSDGFVTAEVARVRKDGTPLALWITASCVRDDAGQISNYVRVFTDISLLKATQEKLEQLASFDSVTGLPNRRLLQDRLDQALRSARRTGASVAVMFIDLDGFKRVNDTLGHDVGDRLLREVGLRLQACVRASDSSGRWGGDEFALIVEGAIADVKLVGTRIVATLARPFSIAGHEIQTGGSIGIALCAAGSAEASVLLNNADLAMFRAKRNGGARFEVHVDLPQPLPE